LYWIPTEFYNTIELARKSPQADIWAFSSTLWELFNYGIILPDVQNVELFKKVSTNLLNIYIFIFYVNIYIIY